MRVAAVSLVVVNCNSVVCGGSQSNGNDTKRSSRIRISCSNVGG